MEISMGCVRVPAFHGHFHKGGKARQGKVRKLRKERNEAERGKYQRTVEQIGPKAKYN